MRRPATVAISGLLALALASTLGSSCTRSPAPGAGPTATAAARNQLGGDAGTGEESLEAAFKKGDWGTVRTWLRSSGDARHLFKDNRTPLHLLAESEAPDLEMARALIQAGAVVETVTSRGDTPLHLAAQRGHLELVKVLVEHGGNVQTKGSEGATLLMYAAQSGNAALASFLVDRGLRVEEADEGGSTPLMYVFAPRVRDGPPYIEVARFLLSRKADPRRQDARGYDAVLHAIRANSAEVLEEFMRHGVRVDGDAGGLPYLHAAVQVCAVEAAALLLRHGANPRAKDGEGRILWRAVMRGNESLVYCYDVDMVKLLLDIGMPATVKNEDGDPYLYEIASSGDDLAELAGVLLQRGANANARSHEGEPCLLAAVKQGEEKTVELLLKHGASPISPSKDGELPLLVAARTGRAEVVKLLLERGADPNSRSKKRDAPLLVAAREGKAEVVKLLLARGARSDLPDAAGRAPLFSALPPETTRVDDEVLAALLEHGASARGLTRTGDTALVAYLRASKGRPDIVRKMIDRGCDPRRKGRGGERAIALGNESTPPGVIDALLAAGEDIDARGSDGRTALAKAVGSEYVDKGIVEHLLQRGANLEARDAIGNTPLMIAARDSTPEIVGLLVRHGANVLAVNELGQDVLYMADRHGSDSARLIAEHLAANVLLLDPPKEPPRAGHAVLTWPNGNRYEGPIEDGKMHGAGKCTIGGKAQPCTYAEGGRLTEGHYYENGDHWAGEMIVRIWADGHNRYPEGRGIMRFGSGDQYTGVWAPGKPVEGTFVWGNIEGTYRGPHLDGRPHGRGVCTRKGASAPCECQHGWPLRPGDEVLRFVLDNQDDGTYVGPLQKGKPHGFGMWRGTQRQPGVPEYWGEWRDGKRQGRGTFVDGGGARYRGPWVGGERHGRGLCFDPGKGREAPCEYVEGRRRVAQGE